MAFGFPAYHTDDFRARLPEHKLRELAYAALSALGWVVEEDRFEVRAKTSMSFWSWGERVTITTLPDGGLSITSRCALPTQCFDWGKNQKNVMRVLDALRERIGSPLYA
jgi:hypothetical protein